MRSTQPIDALASLSRQFGLSARSQKRRCLDAIADEGRFTAKDIRSLHDALYFMRAYPDDDDILRRVRSHIERLGDIATRYTRANPEHQSLLNTGIPRTANTYPYSYAVLRRMTELHPGRLEFDWEQIEDASALADALTLTVAAAEQRGLEDEYTSVREWLQCCKARRDQTDLEVVLELFARSSLGPLQQEHVFEICDFPVIYRLSDPGTGRCEVSLAPRRFFFQRRPIERERFPLRRRIIRPVRDYRKLSEAGGRRILDLSLRALCCRNLEIHPLIYGNPSDVTIANVGRGLQVALAGLLPEFRNALEADFFFLILKNGVPIAYGPASIFLGCCEMGINLFPEFRGGEIRYIYVQFMRTLYHLAAVRYFFLTSYGMGEDNPAALKSGAFWFYRKLGFRATDPGVEDLARHEEATMRHRPGYRSSMSTLRALSHTEAHLDLSRGRCEPTDFEKIGAAVTRYIAIHYSGDRDRAERSCARRLLRFLDVRDYSSWTRGEKRALRNLSPALCLLPLEDWPIRQKRMLVRAIRAKGGRSELPYLKQMGKIERLPSDLSRIGLGGAA